MSSVYIDDIHQDLKELFPLLEKIIEKSYVCPEDQKGTMVQAKLLSEQREATEYIKALCASIEHKIELLNYKLQIIQTFDWGNLYNFKGVCDASEEQRVRQVLQEGKIIVSFTHKEAMSNYILTEISAFFSILGQDGFDSNA